MLKQNSKNSDRLVFSVLIFYVWLNMGSHDIVIFNDQLYSICCESLGNIEADRVLIAYAYVPKF